jgi:hypothetical protein
VALTRQVGGVGTPGVLEQAKPVTRLAVVVALGFVAVFSSPAAAQEVTIQRTPLERELGIIPPTTEPARSRPCRRRLLPEYDWHHLGLATDFAEGRREGEPDDQRQVGPSFTPPRTRRHASEECGDA